MGGESGGCRVSRGVTSSLVSSGRCRCWALFSSFPTPCTSHDWLLQVPPPYLAQFLSDFSAESWWVDYDLSIWLSPLNSVSFDFHLSAPWVLSCKWALSSGFVQEYYLSCPWQAEEHAGHLRWEEKGKVTPCSNRCNSPASWMIILSHFLKT